MNGNDPEFLEAIRLANKFFPESRRFLSQGLDWCDFHAALEAGIDFGEDGSCDPYGIPGYEFKNPTPSLYDRGGVGGSDREVFERILQHTSFAPTGRAIVVPDALPLSGWSMDDRPPFVCAAERVSERLEERLGYVFDGSSDTIVIFESGEAFLLQHDNRLYWARTRNH